MPEHYTEEQKQELDRWDVDGGGQTARFTPAELVTTGYQDPFNDVLKELQDMHDIKGADYGRTEDPYANVRGSEDFGVPAWVGAMVRANDKVRRLQKAASGGTLKNESVEDSLIDLAVYAIIALVLWREQNDKSKYRGQPWTSRLSTLGDPAEDVYFTVKPLGPTTRWGFRRPEGVAVSKFPVAIAHTPDAVTYSHYVEIMGMGKDGILKSVKVEKWDALKIWQKVAKLCGMAGVMFFVWNSSAKQFAVLDLPSVTKLVKRSLTEFGVQSFEQDGNEYYPIPWEWIKASSIWTDDFVPAK